ncbi:sulfotransferase family 2, cytosolic sulfotransferase 3 isoform X2 [Thalassophryne amazonica]|uniref:sulfotransferase family 2, cytosolic sulfotransferase 3 isoform X2 n=1 Tax=Thalassophryne amazonica TaxID=390379 RepID=UPI001470ECE4|nr:sulfotransferase family 2, cytosolic sulfotransferase 3 isoform X2 [Thalassophryne amazonica]
MSSSLYMQYHGLLLPTICHSDQTLKYAQNFQLEDTDVIAVTYPKSGTVWMQEILPLVLNGGDLTPVQTICNWDRVPWLEESRLELVVNNLTSPRAFVSHLPYHLMPASFHTSKAKAIYVMRNPKDVMVSSFYFHQMATFLDDPGTFDEFMDKFLEGRVLFGKWTDHVKSWRHTDLTDRIMYITYEELVQDLAGSLKSISKFLDKSLNEDVIEKIAEHCKFNNMKSNVMSNFSLVPEELMNHSKSSFFRKGISGDWKNHFSPDQLTQFSAIILEELEGETDSLFYDLK